ncbi:hypothetical protein DFR86_11580 [Acidianus sulfidivorans JP7]|nr:hypothetical protein [Acidianus sulfidivorans]AWR98112.2 hypothetical protein DFR86_11580 [Acidianus sulfidivorans JP7]
MKTQDGYNILAELTETLNYERKLSKVYEVARKMKSYSEDETGIKECKELLRQLYKVSSVLLEEITATNSLFQTNLSS